MIINNLQKIRTKKKVSPSTLSKKFGLSLEEIYNIENNKDENKFYTNKELVNKMCKYFNVVEDDLFTIVTKVDEQAKGFYKNTKHESRVVFLDSSSIMNCRAFAQKFLRYFSEICLTTKVYDEINNLKESGHGVKADKAQNAFREIARYKKYIKFNFEGDGLTNDAKILNAAYKYAKENPNKDVYFLSDDKYHTSINIDIKNLTIYKGKEFEGIVGGIDKTYSKEETTYFWKYIENKNSASVLRMDLENVDVNFKNTDEMTPLCYAIENKMWDVVSLLIERPNVDLNEVGCPPNGYGALHYAVSNNQYDLVEKLDANGAYMNLLSKYAHVNNVTPLMIASYKGNIEIMNYLLRYTEFSFNQQDSEGATALHYAAKGNKAKAYVLLVEEGADGDIIDSDYDRADEIMKRKIKSN